MLVMKKVSGFTLIELLVSITILAILLAFAVPSFRTLIQNSRATSQANEFITSINQARSEALKRQATISVIASAGGTAANEFGNGWSIVVDADSDGVLDAGEVIVASSDGYQGGATLNSTNNVSFLSFQTDGTLTAARAFELRIPECRGTSARNMSISRIGHLTVTSVAC